MFGFVPSVILRRKKEAAKILHKKTNGDSGRTMFPVGLLMGHFNGLCAFKYIIQ